MTSVWNDYKARTDEINLYFDYIITSTFSDDDVFKIMKANAFLMLYNLIESTVRNSLDEIHNAFSSENITFSECIDELKALWIDFEYKKFKEKSAITIANNINFIGNDIISITYAEYISRVRSNDISGNLDRRKIELLAEKYKFDKNRRIIGTELFTIKNKRNALAHGLESFIGVGRIYNAADLVRHKRVTILYLREMLNYIEKYIQNKKFKKINP